MKKLVIVVVVLGMVVAGPLAAQWRVDLGLDLAFAGAAIGGGESDVGGFDGMVLPVPIGTGSLVLDAGPLTIGGGIRAIPLIVIVPFWPDIFAELDFGPATVEAHLGGLAFGYFGIVSGIETGNVFIPEVSGWLKLGRRFRVGGGAVGAWAPDVDLGSDNGLSAWLFFGGIKWVIEPDA